MAITTSLNDYQQLFDTCIITASKYPEIDSTVTKIAANQNTYEHVGKPLGIPWYFIGVIHNMEAGLSFKTHLHNGDSLNAKTIQVPKGRPLTGKPPFSWEVSATDALTLEGFAGLTDWDIPNILRRWELYNGIGYQKRGIHSPYLWSYSNHYTKGKFVQDGRFDAEAVSSQCGAAVLLRRMLEKNIIPIGNIDRVSQIKSLGATVPYNPTKTPTDAGLKLQTLLNSIGYALKLDGCAGGNTSLAYQHVAGIYLKGDTRG